MTRLEFRAVALLVVGLSLAPAVRARADEKAVGKVTLTIVNIEYEGTKVWLPGTIVAHKGDKRLFWDRSNWQPLCVTCHSRAKQIGERRAAP